MKTERSQNNGEVKNVVEEKKERVVPHMVPSLLKLNVERAPQSRLGTATTID